MAAMAGAVIGNTCYRKPPDVVVSCSLYTRAGLPRGWKRGRVDREIILGKYDSFSEEETVPVASVCEFPQPVFSLHLRPYTTDVQRYIHVLCDKSKKSS